MKTATINIYTFDELPDDAKEVAREWWREGLDYPWWAESLDSIRAFCDRFGVSIKDYSVGAFSPAWITTDAQNANFRGLKLKTIDRDAMPTGYCLDATLYRVFYDTFKATGDALAAFNEAVDAAVYDIRNDMEWQLSDECVDEMLSINGYEFTEDGKIY